MRRVIIFLSCLNLLTVIVNSNSYGVNDVYRYKIFKAGSVKPEGWIREQLDRDLTEGYIGKFDQVSNTVAKKVFFEQNRLSRRHFGFRKEWWSGEHEGYWKDAVIRMAFLTGNDEFKKLSEFWMDEILECTGEDGYIGIYRKGESNNCRFNHIRENGELWATSRILMAMLAYYEYSGDERILAASENAARLIMQKYHDKNYFIRASAGGGVGHGVGFFENLEWLFRITGNTEYLDFAVKLYDDFNNGFFRDDDLKVKHLLTEDKLFEKHGAHIAEGLFIPQFVAAITGESKFMKAAENTLNKLSQHLTPGGAMRCDEFVKGRQGTADERYEYCGIAEMISPLNKMIAISGDLSLADSLETMTFNAGQGSRFPVLRALSYLTSDNRIKINHRELVKRESYDANHFAAACCVLNGGRLMPYYVEGMWMEDVTDKGLVAVLLGPCELNTYVRDISVRISEETDYPFSDEIVFHIDPEKEVHFPLTVRKPHGCADYKIDLKGSYKLEENENFIKITKSWKKGDILKIRFDFLIKKVRQPGSRTVENEGAYVRRGPLVYSLAFSHRIENAVEHGSSGFYRHKIYAPDTSSWGLRLNMLDSFYYTRQTEADLKHPWDEPVVYLEGYLRDKKNEKKKVQLVPMGNTIFRRVTFTLAPDETEQK